MPPERWLAAAWPRHPFMLRPWESKRGVLGWLQAFRHGRDVPVPVWRERSAAPMATLAKSSLVHDRGHHALAAMPKVRVTRCLGGGQRCGVPAGVQLGGAALPWEQDWSCAKLRVSL